MTSLALALADVIDHHGSVAATARALRWARTRIERALEGDVAPHTVDALALARAHAALRRCAACGDVLHARWTDATCAACQRAVVEEADARADDGEASWLQWAARRPKRGAT